MENRKRPEDMNEEELVRAMDEDAANIGLIIADLYRTITMALKKLPDMKLSTEFIQLTVGDEGMSVFVGDRRKYQERSHCDHHEQSGFDEYFNDDEEGMVYDEIN